MSGKRCTVAYALPDTQWLWPLELPEAATVDDAIAAARAQALDGPAAPQVDWDSAAVGIYGVVCDRQRRFADGDRIEIYRPLAADPRAARRARTARSARARR